MSEEEEKQRKGINIWEAALMAIAQEFEVSLEKAAKIAKQELLETSGPDSEHLEPLHEALKSLQEKKSG